jgi:hypothetical protein
MTDLGYGEEWDGGVCARGGLEVDGSGDGRPAWGDE